MSYSTNIAAVSQAVFVWNPVDWDPKDDLPHELHEYADYARYIVHLIHWRRICDRSVKHGMVPLKYDYLKKVCRDTEMLSAVIQALLAEGVVQTDNHYIIGSKCKCYRLNPRLYRTHVKTEVQDRTVARCIMRQRAVQNRPPELDVHKHLHYWLQQVEIDRENAVNEVWFPRTKRLIREYDEFYDNDTETDHLAAIDYIHDREFFFKVDDQGRCHTNISSLLSCLRKHLRFRSERLVNLDIRNSQPLLLSVLVRNFLRNAGGLESVHNFDIGGKSRKAVIPPCFSSSLLPPSLYDSQNLQMSEVLPEDLSEYIHWTETGMFYDRFMVEAGIEITEETRRQFKKDFFGETFFCKNNHEGKASGPFRERFPSLYDTIRQLKARDHTVAPRLLQRIESDIIINRIARRCMEDLPDAFVATIHDSLLVTEVNAPQVMSIMLDCFRGVGLRPTIRIQHD